MTEFTHLAVRHKTGGGFDVTLTLPDERKVDLSNIALADGFAIVLEGSDDPNSSYLTLACKIVITDLDIDLHTLRAALVDSDGEPVTLDTLNELIAGGTR